MSDDSDEEVFDYEEICYNKSIDKCSICNKVLIPDCGPYEDENDHENEIVVACDNNHRFHRGCIRGVTGSVCPFPECRKNMKPIDEMVVVDKIEEEYYHKINNEKKGGRRKRKSVRKTRKHKRRTYKRRTYKRRTYRRK